MKNTFPDYYKEFVCIADRCPDTCCAGWEIVVDGKSAERYSAVGGDFGEKLRRVMCTDAEGDLIFKSVNGRCPFLLENGLCEMYEKLGKASLCETCTRFPRHTAYFGSRSETGLSLSCPEAARIIMHHSEPIKFITRENGENFVPSDFDSELYLLLLKIRSRIIEIIQNRSRSVEANFADALLLCEKLDRYIKHGEYYGAEKVLSDFKENGGFPEHRPSAAKKALKKYISDHLEAEMLDHEWKSILISARLDGDYPDKSELENLAVYFIFRYLILAAYDGDLSGKIRFCAAAFTVIKALCVSEPDKHKRIRIMQRYSREIENSADNTAFLSSRIKKSRYYGFSNLINILSSKEI